MKKMMILAMMMVMTISARAMSYSEARSEALFLSDKMAYELKLTDAQYDAVYEINLDYLLCVNSRNDLYGSWWERRNADLRYVLSRYQYDKFIGLSYFYRPLSWERGGWRLAIYSRYDRTRFFKSRPTVYVHYKGGNNRKQANFYSDRIKHSGKSSTWRSTGKGRSHDATSVRNDNSRSGSYRNDNSRNGNRTYSNDQRRHGDRQ